MHTRELRPLWLGQHFFWKGRWYLGLQGQDLLLLLWRAQSWTLGYPQVWVLRIQNERSQWQEEEFEARLKKGQACCNQPGQDTGSKTLKPFIPLSWLQLLLIAMSVIKNDSRSTSFSTSGQHCAGLGWSLQCYWFWFLAGRGQGEGVQGRQDPKQVWDLSFMFLPVDIKIALPLDKHVYFAVSLSPHKITNYKWLHRGIERVKVQTS